MSRNRPQRAKIWFFTLMALVWVGSAIAITQRLAPRPYGNSEDDLRRLEVYGNILETQDDLLDEVEDVYREIQATQFGIYQDYKILELQDRVNALKDSTKAVSGHQIRVGNVLDILLKSRQEHVSRMRTVAKTAEAVRNCQEGNNYVPEE